MRAGGVWRAGELDTLRHWELASWSPGRPESWEVECWTAEDLGAGRPKHSERLTINSACVCQWPVASGGPHIRKEHRAPYRSGCGACTASCSPPPPAAAVDGRARAKEGCRPLAKVRRVPYIGRGAGKASSLPSPGWVDAARWRRGMRTITMRGAHSASCSRCPGQGAGARTTHDRKSVVRKMGFQKTGNSLI